MSLATRCTHCGTIFKVVQDQLKVSEGWVRCGRCNEVFNALPGLFDLDKDPPPPRPAHAPPPSPEPAPGPDPLVEQGLMDEASVDLDYDSQAPEGWAKTQPASIAQQTVDESALALDPEPIEATTDFELDTSIAVDDNTPLEDVIASVTPRPQPAQPTSASTQAPGAEPLPTAASTSPAAPPLQFTPTPQPWLEAPPEDVPSTDEEDALDSRYLMPTARERRAPRRREDGPEFADAEFPNDAFIDAEEDWASDFGPSALDAEAAGPAPAPVLTPTQTPTQTPAPAATKAPSTSGLRPTGATPLANDPQREPPPVDDLPSTQPSRFGDEYPPELGLAPPPDKRKGRGEKAPEFLRRAQRKAFWRHPATRALLSLMALGLLLGLGLQMAYQFRDLFAAYYPASRPVLAQWCEVAGCEIKPPLKLEDLQVDNIELVRTSSEGPDSYRLAVVVHNKGAIDLAWPHIDLTLTDDSGAVIARRAFSPQDARWLDTADAKADAASGSHHAATASRPPPAVPSQRSTTLQWRLLAPDIKPAGYTAELFYP
ncbi:MAG: DUF3426 domain-containing protein [Aquabacterium sp.]